VNRGRFKPIRRQSSEGMVDPDRTRLIRNSNLPNRSTAQQKAGMNSR